MAEDDLELLIHLPLLPQCWNYRCAPPYALYCDGVQALGLMRVFYQLSYIPSPSFCFCETRPHTVAQALLEHMGVHLPEPVALPLRMLVL